MLDSIAWISKEKLPAVCKEAPDLYMICKKNKSSMSVGMFNCFADCIIEPVIKLDRKYENVKFVNCNGRLDGDTLYIDGEIGAFNFVAFEVF